MLKIVKMTKNLSKTLDFSISHFVLLQDKWQGILLELKSTFFYLNSDITAG